MNRNYPDRVSLGQFPTPLEPLARLSAHLGGPEIWIKRDDQSGLASGGNKVRKLEFSLAAAIAAGANHLVTLGGAQSNHCRQTAAAAVRCGMGCSLALRGHQPDGRLGNLLLDDLLGAEIHFAGDREREEIAQEIVAAKRAAGFTPYLIPLGASDGIGTLGFAAAMEELLAQCADHQVAFDAIILASSSAGTQAGLVLGKTLYGFSGQVLGLSIDACHGDMTKMVSDLAAESARLIGAGVSIDPNSVLVNADYLGEGYAIVGDLERDAIRTVARTEGILLDPVYTGRAMGGLIDLIRQGRFRRSDRILFWHTGGAAALSAFHETLES